MGPVGTFARRPALTPTLATIDRPRRTIRSMNEWIVVVAGGVVVVGLVVIVIRALSER